MKISLMKYAFAALTAMAFSAATADVGVYVDDGGVNPRSFADGTFSGSTTLRYGALPLTCNLSLDGEVEANATGDGGTLTVTGGSVTGGFLCGTVSLSAFPWVSQEVPESALATLSNPNQDVEVTFEGVAVNLCGSGLTVTAVFNNNGTSALSAPSSFTFVDVPLVGSSCRLDGALTVEGDDIDAFGGL